MSTTSHQHPTRIPRVRVALAVLGLLVAAGIVVTAQRGDAATGAIRINTGGSARTVSGVSWLGCTAVTACNGYVSGGNRWVTSPTPSITGAIAPADSAIYQSEWTGGATGGIPAGATAFTFAVPVTAGSYAVRLHFAENVQTAAGKRTFDVDLEGARVLSDFDIYAAAGGRNKAIVREFPVTVTDGSLTIRFVREVENAKISGIEIVPTGTTPTTPPPTTTPPTTTPPSSGGVGSISWVTATPPAQPRHEGFGGFAGNGLFYAMGGYKGGTDYTPLRRVDRYNPATKTWTRMRDLPIGLTHSGVAIDGQYIYLAGGYPEQPDGSGQNFSTNQVWRYDTATDTYTALPAMPAGRGGGALVLVGRTLHVFGGADSARKDTATHYALDLDGGGWVAKAPMPQGANHLAGVNLNGTIYAIAGQNGQDAKATYGNRVYAYNPATNAWTARASYPVGLSHHNASTLVVNGRIVVMGGEIGYGKRTAAVRVYNPATNSWSSTTNLPAARDADIAGYLNGKIYFVAGGTSKTMWIGTVN
jgi:N-acetylneuraminic acid mutarotase